MQNLNEIQQNNTTNGMNIPVSLHQNNCSNKTKKKIFLPLLTIAFLCIIGYIFIPKYWNCKSCIKNLITNTKKSKKQTEKAITGYVKQIEKINDNKEEKNKIINKDINDAMPINKPTEKIDPYKNTNNQNTLIKEDSKIQNNIVYYIVVNNSKPLNSTTTKTIKSIRNDKNNSKKNNKVIAKKTNIKKNTKVKNSKKPKQTSQNSNDVRAVIATIRTNTKESPMANEDINQANEPNNVASDVKKENKKVKQISGKKEEPIIINEKIKKNKNKETANPAINEKIVSINNKEEITSDTADGIQNLHNNKPEENVVEINTEKETIIIEDKKMKKLVNKDIKKETTETKNEKTATEKENEPIELLTTIILEDE